MKITRVKLTSIVALICFIGCSIQIYDITCIYLKFKVRSEVTYDYTDLVELPTIDIIIPITESINFTELFTRYPEQIANFCHSYIASLNNVSYTIDNFKSVCSHQLKKVASLASFNIARLINAKDIKELTIDPRKQIHYIQIANSGFITNQCNFTRYYSGMAIYLRISCTEQAALITENMIVGSHEGNIATIGHSLGADFGIRFTSPFDEIAFEFKDYFMVSQPAGEIAPVWVRYEKIVSRSHPYPYESNCRYYNKLKVLHDCVANFTFYQGFWSLINVNEWDTYPEHLGFIDNAQTILYQSNCAELMLVPECEKTSYLIDGGIVSEQVNKKSGLIFIEKPMTPTMYFNVHPNLLLSEYIIFVGSIIGTWFGIAIFHSLISILILKGGEVIGKIRKIRESKRPIKIFIVRNPYFSDPLLHSPSYSPRLPLHINQLIHLKSIHENLDS